MSGNRILADQLRHIANLLRNDGLSIVDYLDHLTVLLLLWECCANSVAATWAIAISATASFAQPGRRSLRTSAFGPLRTLVAGARSATSDQARCNAWHGSRQP